jgi:hypothetical protein
MGPSVLDLRDAKKIRREPISTRISRMISRIMMLLVCLPDAYEVLGGVLIVAGGTCETDCTPGIGGVVCKKGLGRVVGLGGAIFCTAGFPGKFTIFFGGSNVGDDGALGIVLDVPVMGARACAFI